MRRQYRADVREALKDLRRVARSGREKPSAERGRFVREVNSEYGCPGFFTSLECGEAIKLCYQPPDDWYAERVNTYGRMIRRYTL